MRVWLHNPHRRIVVLRWWQFTFEQYKLLLEIQRICPNQVVELVGSGIHAEYIPLHSLNLENYHMLRRLNV